MRALLQRASLHRHIHRGLLVACLFALGGHALADAATLAASDGLLYYSTLNNSEIAGVPGPFDDGDIYRFDPASGQTVRIFDARNAGLPGNADIDALHVIDPVTFYMSFNRNGGTQVPGLGAVMDDDIVIYHAGLFSWFLKGADVGLGDDGNGEDVSALYVISPTSLLVSTAGTPQVSGVSGARAHDVLRCDGVFGATSSCSWSMHFDGSKVGLKGSAEKIDALFALDGDLFFSTTGNFSVAGLSGRNNDLARCEGTSNSKCNAFSKFFDGNQAGFTDNLDAAAFQTDAFVDPDPGLYRVVVLGSSTASGSGASPASKSWAALFDAWLGTATARHEMLNMAKSGLSTVEFLPDGTPGSDPNRDISRMLEVNPDLIVINLPSNNVAQGIPVSTTIEHYRTMVAAADAAGVPLFMTTTQPRNFSDLSQRVLLQDEAIAIRTEFGARVIDIYDELVDYNNNLGLKAAYDSGDGTHLNNAGHQYVFETVRNAVSSVVTP